MFTKLLLATSAIGALSAPVANYQHTTQEGNVNITYQYETNEVNSLDDLIVGNVYHFSVDSAQQFTLDDLSVTGDLGFYLVNGYCSFLPSDSSIDETLPPIILDNNADYSFDFTNNFVYSYVGTSTEDSNNYTSIYFENVSSIDFDFDFVLIYSNELTINLISYISSSNYNVITNVQEVYHTGLFGNLADFLRYHIYGGIPHVTDIQFEIANQTITMLDWLVVTTSIALAVLSLVLLFYFFRWVFKLVSGLLLLR